MSSVQSWVNDFAARHTQLPGAKLAWLAAMRQRAIERFATEGWPTTKHEDWRHTSLAPLEQVAFDTQAQPVDVEAIVRELRGDEPGCWLVFVDGRHAPALGQLGALPSGVRIGTLADALAHEADLVQQAFGSETDGGSPAALNLALASDGAFVHLAPGAVLEEPIHVVFVASGEGAAAFTRNLYVAEAGSQGNVVEHYIGRDGNISFTNTVSRVQVAADARLVHTRLQQEAPEAFHLAAIDVEQAGKSYFASHSISLGARLARHDIATRFDGTRAESLLNGVYYANGQRHVDHHTLIGHAQPNCVSHEHYRGILADRGRGVFRGRILVAPGADGTDAIQRNDSLLLSRLARNDSKPELEIYAEDVRCTHGATVGQLNEDSLFYLMARGLDEEHARNVLIYAFVLEGLARIEPEAVRRRASHAVRALTPGGHLLEELE
ncbi:MAG TPA: Fe-S cluster assembly protein SufD [Burkholderiaceae bacterium]|nr:Fe-S cluster assembly protein SufD [bacterium SGD-2]HZH57386.1 Fe-S cluster assembly protein SufD [Burkholderiaceae bacterium]